MPAVDVERTITYKIVQRTNAPSHGLERVIERFKRELELQFGSSVDVIVEKIEHA